MKLDEIILNEELRNKFLGLKDQDYSYDIAFFIPQCLRSNYCEAKNNNGSIECTSCYKPREDGEKCVAGKVKDELINLNKNISVYIVKGGSVLPKILVEYGKPRTIVGIACPLEISQSEQLLRYLDINIKTIPLIKDGCSETKFDEKAYDEVLKSLL